MIAAPYQFLPPLVPDEFEALKASIAERGVDVPIIVDQEGNTIDGFHRQRACDELGIFCPREVRQFESEADKLELVLRLNCGRRQLNRKQKRAVIEAYLLRDPQIADHFLAQIIAVSKNTVAAVRGELEATCQIDKFDILRGRDGKQRPVRYKKIVANTPKEAETALKVIGDLPDNCAGKTIDIITARRRATRNQNAARREEQRNVVLVNPDDDIRLYYCPFQKLQSIAGIAPESVQLICTDIPYDKSFLSQVEELGQFAQRVLNNGGYLVTYSGQYWLPDVFELLGKSLNYRWTKASFWDADATPVRVGDSKVVSKWKPILVFSKGGDTCRRQWHDVSHVVSKEKHWHPWQQPLAEVEKLIEDFSQPGDLVIDTCGGGFTTAIACFNKNRRFVGCDIEEKSVAAGQERLRLNRELRIYLWDADGLNRPFTDGVILNKWAGLEGISVDLAGHVLRDMPDNVRTLLHSERKGVILGPVPDCDGTTPITFAITSSEQPDNRSQEFTITEVGKVQVWCGDSLSLMQNQIAPKSVEVVVTSTPYNTGMKYGAYDDNRPEAEYFDWLDKVFAAIKLVLTDDGSFFLNIGSKPTAPKRARLVTEVAERHFVVQNEIKWVKAISIGNNSLGHYTPLNSERFLNHNWEYVLHFSKNGDVPIDRLAIGVPYKDKNNINRSTSKNKRHCRGNVWFIPHETVQSQSGKWNHPCPFPVTLAEWCIRLHGRSDDMLVLDPFNGVGSSTVAMTRVGVSGIGIDIDPAYCEAAVKRMEDELAQELIICIWDCFSVRERTIPASDVLEWAEREKLCDEVALRLLGRIPEEVRRLVNNGNSSAA